MSLALEKLTIDPDFPTPIARVDSSQEIHKSSHEKIAVVGLGYVGLPLATRLANRFEHVVGYDISTDRITALRNGSDVTNEVDEDQLRISGLRLSNAKTSLRDATFYIVTVPTPVTDTRQPDLTALRSACHTLAPFLKLNDVVVFESTVFPGATEEVCGPLLADLSGLRLGSDFTLGYSPERINPGDKKNTIETVKKIIAGQTPETKKRIFDVYQQIIPAGLHQAPSIKVAEAAKVLENVQRDVNIALMNEVSQICDKIGIKSKDVITAASTKWNFARYQPGLVGGHCIGVDPYYLAATAQRVGLNPDVILAGRRVNDGMCQHVIDQILRMLLRKSVAPTDAQIGVFGLTFKEDVPDLRNSKSIELVERLRAYGLDPVLHDPHCNPAEAKSLGVPISNDDKLSALDLMIIPTPHRCYRRDPRFLRRLKKDGSIIDVKGAFAAHLSTKTHDYWSL